MDLRYKNRDIMGDISVLLTKIANEKRDDFTRLINEYSKKYENNLDWWFASPSSRNTIASRLYFNYCCIYLVDSILKKGHTIDIIIVETQTLKKAYRNIVSKYNSNTKIYVKRSGDVKVISYLKNIYYILNRLYGFLISKTLSIKLNNKTPITLIDTFCFPGYITKDRYYSGLLDHLSEDQKSSIYFVPSISGIYWNDWYKVYNELKKSKKNYLLREKYLHLSDYFYSIAHFIRFYLLPKNTMYIADIDFSSIIKDEFNSLDGYQSSIEAFLNYMFFYRLKQKKIKIRFVIDWWENQVIDKGWNYGKNKYFPDVDSIGYLGYVPRDLELQLFPTELEKINRLLPNRIGIIGQGFSDTLNRYIKNYSFFQSPGFRFKHLWNQKEEKVITGKILILVALSILNDESIDLIDAVILAQKDIDNDQYDYLIKFHPVNDKRKILKGIKNKLPINFHIEDKDTNTLLRKVHLLIGGTSSICLESLAMGVPAIIANFSPGIRYNPIPESISKHMWTFANCEKDIAKSLMTMAENILINPERFNTMGNEIKKSYFNPLSKKYINRFMNYTIS